MPVGNPGLASDREYLLALRDALAGSATLNWSAGAATGEWDGVTVTGAPPRVTGLNLANRGLDGEIWGWFGDLTELTVLRLEGNRLTGSVPSKLVTMTTLAHIDLAGNSLEGCIPPPLRAAARHDRALSGLPDCTPPILLEPAGRLVSAVHDGASAVTYHWWRGSFSSVFDLPRGLEVHIFDTGHSTDDRDFVDCPPCIEGVFTERDLAIELQNPHLGAWLLLDPFTGTEWWRSHYPEDSPSSARILKQIAASIWVNTAAGENREWVWP